MDGSQLIESFDSLWLFSSVLSSSRAQHLGPPSDENATKNHTKESIKEEPSNPMSPILQSQQNESQNDVIVSQRCPTCGEFAEAEIEPVIVQRPFVSEVVEFVEGPKKEEKMRRRKRSKGSKLHQRRKILEELDMGFERSIVSESWETCGYQRVGVQHNMKMPPLSDGMAMKEHLKSWAYAVACTVK